MTYENLSIRLVLLVLAYFVSQIGLFQCVMAQEAISDEIKRAVLTESWQLVNELCGTQEQLTRSPIRRALKAHALLAINQNNESLKLFLSIASDDDLRDWTFWTEQLLQEHRNHAIACYLRGDALARIGKYDAALHFLNQALKFKHNFALALNARGVVHTRLENWDDALEDLETACKIAPEFAEAYASLGTLLVLRKAPDGAIYNFNRALEISSDFVLALNGRGCARFGSVDWDKANDDFARALDNLRLPIFYRNLRGLALAIENAQLVGQENSPLFRVTDFLDWFALHQRTLQIDDILQIGLGHSLPDTLEVEAIRDLNALLDDKSLFGQVRDKFIGDDLSEEIVTLLENTEGIRAIPKRNLNDTEREQIRILNRRLIEHAYPTLIVKFDQRKPGMQLSLRHGLIDDRTFLQNQTPAQIVSGQWRMDHLWRPMADALQSSGIPLINFAGAQLNRHYARATQRNVDFLSREYGMNPMDIRPGGVLADLRKAYVDKGDWPVTNWFGLAYVAH